MTIRQAIDKYFICVLILASAAICQAQGQAKTDKPRKIIMNIKSQTAWKEKMVTIYRDGKPPLTDVVARECVYKTEIPRPGFDPLDYKFTVTAFIVPESGRAWIGLEQPNCFFVESAGDVHCGHLDSFGRGVSWITNLAKRMQLQGENVEELSTNF